MKIDLNLSPEELVMTSAELKGVYNSKAFSRKEKTVLSIALDVAKLFDKKTINLQATLFTQKKKYKISLKHHEADILEIILIQQMSKIENKDLRRVVQNVIAKLNQKLA